MIAARDGVVTVGKMAGLELGKFLKFKPWGAIKFAKGMNGALVFVGVALELWDTYNQAKREEEFKKMIESMVGNFNQQREGLINTLEESDFDRKHFTGFAEMQDEMTNLETTMQAIRFFPAGARMRKRLTLNTRMRTTESGRNLDGHGGL